MMGSEGCGGGGAAGWIWCGKGDGIERAIEEKKGGKRAKGGIFLVVGGGGCSEFKNGWRGRGFGGRKWPPGGGPKF